MSGSDQKEELWRLVDEREALSGLLEIETESGVLMLSFDCGYCQAHRSEEERLSLANRTVAEHNALLDLDPEAVPELVTALEGMVEDAETDDSEACHCETVCPLDAPTPPRCSYCQATAALAKVKGAPGRNSIKSTKKETWQTWQEGGRWVIALMTEDETTSFTCNLGYANTFEDAKRIIRGLR